MAEEGSDGIQAHAPVDGLRGEGVPQLVRGDVADTSCLGLPGEGQPDAVGGERAAPIDKEALGAQPRWPVLGHPLVQHLLQLRVERYVTVVVELADGHPQPVRRADLDDRVNAEAQKFADPEPGPGEQLGDKVCISAIADTRPGSKRTPVSVESGRRWGGAVLVVVGWVVRCPGR